MTRPSALIVALLGLAGASATSARADRIRVPEPRGFAAAPARLPARSADAIVVESDVSCGKSRGGQSASMGSSSSADVRVLIPVGRSSAMVSRLWGRTVRDGDASITLGMAASGVRRRIAGPIWIEAGFGVAHTSVQRSDDLDVVGLTSVMPAAVVAAGADLGEWAGVAFDLELRAGSSVYEDALPARDGMGLLRARW